MPPLHVVGGPAGAAARFAELDDLAVRLAELGSEVAALARDTTGAVVATQELGDALRRAALVPEDPVLPARAWPFLRGEAASAGAGAHGAAAQAGGRADALLRRAAGRLRDDGERVALAVEVYRAREATLHALAVALPTGLAVLGRASLLHALLAPGGAARLGGAALLALPLLLDERLRERALEAGGGVLVDRPGLVDLTVQVLPPLLGAPGPRGLPRLARQVARLGAGTGALVDGPVQVRRRAVAARCGTDGAAGSVADLLTRSQGVASWREPSPGQHDPLPDGAQRPGRGEVRVDEVTGPDGSRAWVVHVPGTQEWDGDGEGSPMDLTANVRLVGGADTAVTVGVTEAVRRAGVRRGEPVLLVGHSQGGLTAQHLAGDPAFREVATVTHVVTAGSPLAGRTPPAGVSVLALEHTDDLVPRLDGRVHHGHRDDADRVSVVTGSPDGPWRTDAVPAHSSSAYVATAARVDASDHPSLVAYRAGLAPFLDREGAVCTERRYVLSRGAP